MKYINPNIKCPSCSKLMSPKVMTCTPCDLEVKANFDHEENLALDSEDLRFVRLFIHCEGRIRDLEKALGVSYPTVKAKIADLKSKLSLDPTEENQALKKPTQNQDPKTDDPMSVLTMLKEGEIDYQTALNQLKSIQSK